MGYKIFYCDYVENDIVESAQARWADKTEILHIMNSVLGVPGNFVGIIDDNDSTLQFMVNDNKSILIDIPDVAKGGSYNKESTLDDCISLVDKLDGPIMLSHLDNMSFVSWT